MAKSSKKKNKKPKAKNATINSASSQIAGLSRQVWMLILFAFSCLLYSNTLGHQYAQDDAIVIYDNMHVKNGISGIPDILNKDSFHGFFKVEGKDKLVSGGRYRPLSLIMFAVGWEIWGNEPFVGHLINILLFGLLCALIFNTLSLFRSDNKWQIMALVAAFIFAAHPIHTEVVANIKGRDEILSLLGSVAALYYILRSVTANRVLYLSLASLSFFLAFLSKENTITYLAVVPMALFLFKDQSVTKVIKTSAVLLIPMILFLALRASVLGWDFGDAPNELMNNPFLKLVNGEYIPLDIGEKAATIIFILGKYIALLFFPHPLTHDYYPRHIDLHTFADPAVWLSIVMYLTMFVFAIKYWKKSRVTSFAILYFLATISIVSNIIFPIGTNLSERFLFMPSIGFSVFVASLVLMLNKKQRQVSLSVIAMFIVCGLMSIKTISRNQVWQDDYTLFTNDVEISKNSAKINNAAAGAISNKYYSEENEAKRTNMIEKADAYAKRAIEIHPKYKNAYLLSGNCNHYLKRYVAAEQMYQKALDLDPSNPDVQKNLAINDREAGKYYGEVQGDLPKAISYLKRAYQSLPDDYETNRLLGVASGVNGDHQSAIKYFTNATKLQPELSDAYRNLSTAYSAAGNDEQAKLYLQKAQELQLK